MILYSLVTLYAYFMLDSRRFGCCTEGLLVIAFKLHISKRKTMFIRKKRESVVPTMCKCDTTDRNLPDDQDGRKSFVRLHEPTSCIIQKLKRNS